MSKAVIVGVIIAIAIAGIAVAVFTSSDSNSVVDEMPEPVSIPEPEEKKGRDIQIDLQDGLTMSSTP